MGNVNALIPLELYIFSQRLYKIFGSKLMDGGHRLIILEFKGQIKAKKAKNTFRAKVASH